MHIDEAVVQLVGYIGMYTFSFGTLASLLLLLFHNGANESEA